MMEFTLCYELLLKRVFQGRVLVGARQCIARFLPPFRYCVMQAANICNIAAHQVLLQTGGACVLACGMAI